MQDRRHEPDSELDRLRFLVNGASEAVLIVGFDGRVVDANPAYHRMSGYQRDEVLTMNSIDIVHPEDLPRIVEHFDSNLDEGPTRPADIRIRHKDGRWRWFETRVERHPDNHRLAVVSARDVSDRRRGEDFLAGQSRVLELIARGAPLAETLAAVSEVVDDRVDTAHTAVVVGGNGALVLAPDLPPEWRREVVIGLINDAPTVDGMDAWLGTLSSRFELGYGFSTPIRERNGRDLGRIMIYSPQRMTPSRVERNALESLASLVAIAVERQTIDARLAHEAHHDQLTGLLNRNGFVQDLDDRIDRGDHPGAVLFVDLDRFKAINDQYGHRVGDEVLIEVASRLRSKLRRGDLLARFGGDEFVAVLFGVSESDAEMFAARMIEELERPFSIESRRGDDPMGDEAPPIRVSASIGIASSGDISIDTEELLHQADVAMFRAKDGSRSRIVRFAGNDEVSVYRDAPTESA